MSSRRRSLLMVATALLLAACGSTQDPTVGNGVPADDDIAEEIVIAMAAQNDSDQSGEATLTTTEDGRTRVVIRLMNSPSGPQPAHIHTGTCVNLDPAPKYPLNDVENGTSETVINVGLQELLDGDFAINVHLSHEQADIYVSCGDIV